MAMAHSRMSRGLQFIAEKFADEMSVEDVARAAGMSRRGLHQAFLITWGALPATKSASPASTARRMLLVETDEKIESVAGLSGYPNTNTFHRLPQSAAANCSQSATPPAAASVRLCSQLE